MHRKLLLDWQVVDGGRAWTAWHMCRAAVSSELNVAFAVGESSRYRAQGLARPHRPTASWLIGSSGQGALANHRGSAFLPPIVPPGAQ